MHGFIVDRAIGLDVGVSPDNGDGDIQPTHALRYRAAPPGRNDGVVGPARAGGAFADNGKDIGLHIHHGQGVVTPLGVGYRDDYRTFAPWTYYVFIVCVGQGSAVHKSVDWPSSCVFCHAAAGGLTPCQVHGHLKG